MTRLGAIFAGGAARRFGSDKARALLDGRALLDHVVDRLRPQCDALVVIGRSWPGLPTVADQPEPGLGPLGALAGALVHARATGFTDVLTSGCDLPDLPRELGALLGQGPAVIAGQPLLGLWPVTLTDLLLRHLQEDPDRAMRGWIGASGAATVRIDRPVANINRPADLDDLIRRR
ncbi:MAG TPA: molybdenum cofactor guanylyltransferase [Sphingomonas sp.]|jgi:molybdopterin-guanine dinucleotide biosynthesis protein A|uniref:molybdenum cofactor guanylyltransferase n=1 Tax=Sphingomonas sp. TaxID=28214 RepID=UPI002ED7CCA2